MAQKKMIRKGWQAHRLKICQEICANICEEDSKAKYQKEAHGFCEKAQAKG